MTASARKRKTTATKDRGDLGDRILEAALELAEERGWRAVRLVDVADRLEIPPEQILSHYRDLNSVADAWFLRAWRAMLAPKSADFVSLPAVRRIEVCLLAWFDSLASHRRVTADMLRGKLHLSHPHHWVPMVFNLSRTIHWLREAAMLPAVYGSRRANMEEVGLTWILLATLAVWCGDATPNQEKSRSFLRRRLEEADRLMAEIWGRQSRANASSRMAKKSKRSR